WESVNRVERGGNYGWSIMEARQPVNINFPPGPTPIRAPLIDLPHTISASVTGGYVYRGTKFPELAGAYIFGDYETKRIWAARAVARPAGHVAGRLAPAERANPRGDVPAPVRIPYERSAGQDAIAGTGARQPGEPAKGRNATPAHRWQVLARVYLRLERRPD